VSLPPLQEQAKKASQALAGRANSLSLSCRLDLGHVTLGKLLHPSKPLEKRNSLGPSKHPLETYWAYQQEMHHPGVQELRVPRVQR
jgi:hypothetical protein